MPTLTGFAQRIALTLPPWWGSLHPNLDTLIAAYAAGSAVVDRQTRQLVPFLRIAGTTGQMLDIAGYDFYGDGIIRGINEADINFRGRIISGLFLPRNVRFVFEQSLLAATGVPPVVIDPRRTADTGYCGNDVIMPTLFYNTVGNDVLTNYRMPYQWFVRLTNTSQTFNNAQLAAYVASLMPAGTVSWIRII